MTKRAVHKRRSAKNLKKLTPPLFRKMSALLNLFPPLVRANTLNFEKSEIFCAKKCGRPRLKNFPCPKNVRTGQPPYLQTSFMDGPKQ